MDSFDSPIDRYICIYSGKSYLNNKSLSFNDSPPKNKKVNFSLCLRLTIEGRKATTGTDEKHEVYILSVPTTINISSKLRTSVQSENKRN